MTTDTIKKPHGNCGKVRSPEHRAKVAAAMRAYWSQDSAKSKAHKAWLKDYSSRRMKAIWVEFKAQSAVSDNDEDLLK